MNKNVYEIFEELKLAEDDFERVDMLCRNSSYALKSVLKGIFHPDVQFTISETPKYKRSDSPIGLGYSNMTQELSRAYLFEANNPKVSPNLSTERKIQILVQILETLEAKEADVYMNMILKKTPIPELTYEVVKKSFPDLLP
jgi:hypothetical protein